MPGVAGYGTMVSKFDKDRDGVDDHVSVETVAAVTATPKPKPRKKKSTKQTKTSPRKVDNDG